MDTLVRIIIILPIVYICFVVIMFTVNVVTDVFTTGQLNPKETIQAAGRTFWRWSTNPFNDFAKNFTSFLRERYPLEVRLIQLEGFTFRPEGGERITGEFMLNRQQYRLELRNRGRYDMINVKLFLQLPYPIERTEVNSKGVTLQPVGTELTVYVEGTGSGIEFSREPLSTNWKLELNKLEISDTISVLLLINNQRDSQGNVIQPENSAMSNMPVDRPSATHIIGTYGLVDEDPARAYDFYAPISLSNDKIVSVGEPTTAPKVLEKNITIDF